MKISSPNHPGSFALFYQHSSHQAEVKYIEPAVCAQVTCLPVSELCVRSSEQPPPPPSAANTSTSFPCALEMILFSFCSGMLQYSLPFLSGLQNAIFICVSCPRSNSLNG